MEAEGAIFGQKKSGGGGEITTTPLRGAGLSPKQGRKSENPGTINSEPSISQHAPVGQQKSQEKEVELSKDARPES